MAISAEGIVTPAAGTALAERAEDLAALGAEVVAKPVDLEDLLECIATRLAGVPG